MLRLDRYILKEIITQFLLLVVVLCGLLLLSQLGRRSELFIAAGVNVFGIFQILGLVLLPFVSFVFPVGYLFAVMFAFSRLTMQGEWYAMQASGYSIRRATHVVGGLAVLLAVICLAVSHIAEPWGFKKLESVVFDSAQKRWDSVLSQTLQAGVFETSMPEWMVYAGEISSDRQSFKEFMLAPQSFNRTESLRLYAPRASLKGSLSSANLTLDLFNGKFWRVQNGEQVVIGFEEMSLPLGAMLKDSFSRNAAGPKRKHQFLSTPDLRTYIARKSGELKPRENNKRLSRAMTTLTLRTGIGLTVIPLSLFGLLAGLIRRRSSNRGSFIWAIGALLLCFGTLAAIPVMQLQLQSRSEWPIALWAIALVLVSYLLCMRRNRSVPVAA